MHLEQLQPKKRVSTFINEIALMSHIVESCPRTKLSNNNVDVCRTAPSSRRLKTKPDDLGCESACTGCQNLHPPSPFIIITQPESWYSFYRPTEGRRLSRPSWLVTYRYRDGLPVHRRSPILVLTGFDIAQLRWSRPTTKPNRRVIGS